MKLEKTSNEKRKSKLDRLNGLTAEEKKKLNLAVQKSNFEFGFPRSVEENTQKYIDIAEKLGLIPRIH
jgi:hypothetical protein